MSATAGTLLFTPNVIGLALGAGLVDAVDPRLLPALFGLALLVTATVLAQSAASASRTADRSASDANPA